MNAFPARKQDETPRNSPEVEAAYEAVPEEEIAEILDGELHVQPRPRSTHSMAAAQLTTSLGPFRPRGGDGPGGWVILYEPELHLGPRPDKLVPDLAGWRRTRMPEMPDVPAFTLPPDWVCEVLSPGTQAIDRGKKMRIYRREGVGHLWLVDPAAQTVEVFRLENGRWSHLDTHEGDTRARLEPFDAIEIDLGALWAR
jgi:Uma2 family endonuclease